MTGPTVEGSIVAKVKADISNLEENISLAEAKIEELTGRKPDVTVKANVDTALTKLQAVEAATDRASTANIRLAAAVKALEVSESSDGRKASTLLPVRREATAALKEATAASAALTIAQAALAKEEDKVAASAKKAGAAPSGGAPTYWGVIAGLVGAVVLTLGPLTATLASGIGGFFSLGAAAVLAVGGIQRAMASGTVTGNAYGSSLQALKTDLAGLQDTAAATALTYFQRIQDDISAAMPQLNAEVKTFTGILGDAGATIVPAIISGLKTMNPLFVDGAKFIDGIAHSFANWVASGGMKKFVEYAEKELPIVENAVDSLARGVVGLGVSFSTAGNGILNALADAGKSISLIDNLASSWNNLVDSVAGTPKSTDPAAGAFANFFKPFGVFNFDAKYLGVALDWLNSLFDGGKPKVQASTAAAKDNSAAIKALAGQYGESVPVYEAALAAQKQTADQLKATTAAMVQENDASGLLTQAFQLLDDKTLNVAQAQTSLDSANNSVVDSFRQNGHAVDGSTKAAVANQQAIQQQVLAAQQAAEAIGKQTGSTAAGTKAYTDSKAALEAQLKAQGDLNPAVQDYINKLYDVANFKVISTKIDVDTAVAQKQLQDYINLLASIPGYSAAARAAGVNINTTGNVTFSDAKNTAASGHATGGSVWGSGSGLSDSIPAMLSSGEFVVTAAAASAPGVRPALNMLNANPTKGLAAAPGAQSQPVVNITGYTDPMPAVMDGLRRLNMRVA